MLLFVAAFLGTLCGLAACPETCIGDVKMLNALSQILSLPELKQTRMSTGILVWDNYSDYEWWTAVVRGYQVRNVSTRVHTCKR